MGLAASQGKLLFMTARLSNNEFEQQCIAYSKQRLADSTQRINDEYLDALNKTQYQILTNYNGTEAVYEDITYNRLVQMNGVASGKQYIVKDNRGKVLVSQQIAKAFQDGNGDYNKFLQNLGLTQANLDTNNHNACQTAIHEAWDKYLYSVGMSINDYKNNHILSFGYSAFEENGKKVGVLEGYPTYNSAYATFTQFNDGRVNSETVEGDLITGYSLYKNDEGNYFKYRQPVSTKILEDDFENKETIVVFQTPEQEGTDDYVQLTNVAYNGEKYVIDGTEYEYAYVSVLPDGLINIYGSNDASEIDKDIFEQTSEGKYTLQGYDENTDATRTYTFDLTDEEKPLTYEGTNKEQRDLYDYAVSLTEYYYNRDVVDEKGNNLHGKYDANKVNYYQKIYNEMSTCGYTTVEKMCTGEYDDIGNEQVQAQRLAKEKEKLGDTNWFVRELKAGTLHISYYSNIENAFIGSSLDDDESIVEKEDKSKIAYEEQVYQNRLDRIEAEDKQFDLQLNKLEAEHSALQTEYESVAKVISKNVEKSFNTFNA